MFNLSIFPASESKKDLKKRKGHNSYLKLSSDIPFDTWKAQLMVKIDEKMKPDRIAYEDYEVSFMIPRISPQPLNVVTEDDYNLLCERTQKAKDQQATVLVQEKIRPPAKVLDILLHIVCKYCIERLPAQIS